MIHRLTGLFFFAAISVACGTTHDDAKDPPCSYATAEDGSRVACVASTVDSTAGSLVRCPSGSFALPQGLRTCRLLRHNDATGIDEQCCTP